MIVFLLSLGLLLSGTMSTMSAKAADKRGFDHPYVQVLFMFVGEFLCLAIAPLLARCHAAGGRDGTVLDKAPMRTGEGADTLIVGHHDAGFETRAEKIKDIEAEEDEDEEETRDKFVNLADVEAQQGGTQHDFTFATVSTVETVRDFPASSTLSEFPAPASPSPVVTVSSPVSPILPATGTGTGVFSNGEMESRSEVSDTGYRLGIPLWKFAVPAMLDVVGSTLIFLGIQKTTPSQFQLMRSALVPFTSFVSFLVFKKLPRPFELLGIAFIVCGIVLVSHGAKAAAPVAPADDGGGDSFLYYTFRLYSDDGAVVEKHDKEDEFIGNMFVLMAQLVIAFMLVWEEKMYQSVNSLVAVGMEGTFGIFFTCGLIFVLQFIDDSSKPYGKAESIHAAFDEMSRDSILTSLLLLNTLAVSLLNSIGVSLMVKASAAHRTVIDTLRIVFIWVASIMVGWEQSVSLIQLASFALLVMGISLYNKIIRLPCFNYEQIVYHHHQALQEPLLTDRGTSSTGTTV